MSNLEYWAKRLQKKGKNQNQAVKPSGKRFKEQIVLGYENPKVVLRYVILSRYVDALKNNDDQLEYHKFLKDENGVETGVLVQRIFMDLDTLISECKRFHQDGWMLDGGKNSCHQRLRATMKQEIPEWFQ